MPWYAEKSSWDQYRHVFEAIVCLYWWDGVTAALQLVSHLKGDALNVALLVPASQAGVARSFGGGVVGALWPPWRLAEHRRQFERTSRSPGDNL